jgi:hypothetical protein
MAAIFAGFGKIYSEEKMPIIAANEQNDARGTARLLASAVSEYIKNPRRSAVYKTALNNAFRLLEAYRTNAFFGFEPPLQENSQETIETLTLLPPIERHVSDVRAALENAISEVFNDATEDQAIDTIEAVLRAAVNPKRFASPSAELRAKAATVFEKLGQQLQYS